MPKFATINPIYKLNAGPGMNNLTQNNVTMTQGAQPALIMELPAGSMIVNGQYVDAKTLTPKFGRIPAPIVVGNNVTNTNGPPYAIVTANFRQMTLLGNGLNSWLVSAYGKLNNNIYDGQNNKLHVYSAFPGSSNVAFSVNSPWPRAIGPTVTPQTSTSGPFSYSIWDGTTENANHDYTFNPAHGGAGVYSNYGFMPMLFRIDLTTPTSTRYLWHTQGFYSTSSGTYYQQLYIGTPAPTGQQYLMYDTTNPITHNPSTLQQTAVSTQNQTLVGTSFQHTRAFLYADNNYIWFWETQWNSTSLPGPARINHPTQTTQFLFLKKMTYGGTETTINNIIPKGLDGTHWPTQNLNETTSSVSIIIPTFEYVTTPRVIFRKLVIDKTSSTETFSNLVTPNDNGNVSTRIYNTQGYGNLYASYSQGGGVVNDDMWRGLKHILTWVTTMPSGNIYLNMGVEQMTTSPDSTLQNYFKPGYRSYGFPMLDVNQMFKIWTYQLDAGLTTATYISESDFSQTCPKYYFPLNDNWNTLYVGGMADYPQDTVWVFNEQYYQWQKVQTLPYNASQVAVDGQSRLWTVTQPGAGSNFRDVRDEINLETITLPYTANVVFANVNLIYTGANISTTANVDVFDAYGSRKSANVTLNIVGSGMTFIDGTTSNTYTTSSTVTTPYSFNVTSGSYARVVATINQILS